MTMTGRRRVMFESEGHREKFRVIPGPAEELEIDRIAAAVQSRWKCDCGNAVGGAWSIAAPKARHASTAVAYGDLAQQTGINDGINPHAVGPRRIHPDPHDVLASHAVITLSLD